MTTSTIKSGDIVALLSHPYVEGEHDIILSGDPLQQSPLMVVVESIEIRKNEETGMSGNSLIQHKCYWYSNKSHSFEFAWLGETFLKIIEKASDPIMELPSIGTHVLFKTSIFELNKRKSSILIESGTKENDFLTISSLMTFVSPILLVSGYKNIETTHKNSKRKNQVIPEVAKLIKVKWFNFIGDKINEILLPISCLKTLPPTPVDRLKTIREIINNGHYIKTEIDSIITLLKPLSIHYVSGYYMLRAHDFLTNRMFNNIHLIDMKILDTIECPATHRAPIFRFEASPRPIKYPLEIIQEAERENKTIRIKYVNKDAGSSIRCVKNITVNKLKENDMEYYILTGFCLLKNDTRYFNVERIEWVELINI